MSSSRKAQAADYHKMGGTSQSSSSTAQALGFSFDSRSERIVYLNEPQQNDLLQYTDNSIFTSKYTPVNFLPKFLYSRLSQVANFYFLLVGAGQIIPSISSTAGIPFQWMVLTIVLSVDAIFAGIEDAQRHNADKKVNSRITKKFDRHSNSFFSDVSWRDVKVGDILQLRNHEAVPADILLLAVYEPDVQNPTGICFVETKSLDGETNLKIRQALGCTFSQLSNPSSLGNLPGCVIFEKPNHDVNKFIGRFEPEVGQAVPLELKNIALRGTAIRNTPFVYGLVLNTGSDTKIMQSARETPSKQSKTFDTINKGVALLMALLISFCILGGVFSLVWVNEHKDTSQYLHLLDLSGDTPFRDDTTGFFIYFGYFWILIASLVPITLYVSIAIVKGYQTFFLNRDLEMYDELSDTPALVRNADLNDELGQITHIFSDKTGTLTANVMDFRKMSINGSAYGKGTTEIGRVAHERAGRSISHRDLLADEIGRKKNNQPANVNFIDPMGDFEKDRYGDEKDCRQSQLIERFLIHLSICHSVVIESHEDDDETSFSASSPDELALVSGAAYLGYKFIERTHGKVVIETPDATLATYEMLEIIEFTSTRKRMSVIARNPDGRIFIYVKGADSVMLRLLDTSDPSATELTNKTKNDLERFASEGLRTLVIAEREIDPVFYARWSVEYQAALSDLEENKKQNTGQSNRIDSLEEEIEQKLTLLGATAIEDRLQDGVPSTIGLLGKAGIKIWVLTGDKEETAINVGYACRLINNDMQRLVFSFETCSSPAAMKEILISKCKEFDEIQTSSSMIIKKQAIVIDGDCLGVVFDYPVLKSLFLEVSQQCDSVICCRVSPKQKAQVVELFKTEIKNCRTLAIGDGANDVGMIQEAHVGVGISGYEGMQAVNSSDFAIGQFRFLKRLLLVHGHWNYRRMSKLILYVVYKNIMLYFTLYVLAIYPGGSGTLFYNNMWINGFNVFWTSVPIICLGVLEQETSDELAVDNAGLYSSGIIGEMFNLKIFSQWVSEAFFESSVCALIPLLLFGKIDSKGNSYSFQTCGAISFSAMQTVCWVKLILNTVTWNFIMHITVWGSVLFWYISALVVSLLFAISISDQAFPYVLGLPEFYMLIMMCIVLCLFRDYVWKVYKREYYPEYYHILQEVDALRINDSGKYDWTPPPIQSELYRADPQLVEDSSLPGDMNLEPVQLERMSSLAVDPHRGFAFSTPFVDSHNFNPIRDIILFPVTLVKHIGAAFSSSPEDAFIEYLSQFDEEDREIYEIQRYQVFSGWGSTRPGHLLPYDPPRFTSASMKQGCSSFDTSEYEIDFSFGGSDHWQYALRFKDFKEHKILRDYSSKKLMRRFNKLIGRNVRRRRWILRRQSQQLEPISHSEE